MAVRKLREGDTVTEFTFDQKCTDCGEVLTFLAHATPNETGGTDSVLHWDENPVPKAHFMGHDSEVKD